jgi:Helix-turn-helix domain
MKPKELTTREVAERLGVAQSSVRVWLNREPDRFPNARRMETGRGLLWLIPVSDLKGFARRRRGRKPQKGKGRKNDNA